MMKRKLQLRQLKLKQHELMMMRQEVLEHQLKARQVYRNKNMKSVKKPSHEKQKKVKIRRTRVVRNKSNYKGNCNKNSCRTTLEKGEDICDQRFGNPPVESFKKNRHCRHFLKGFCQRGDTCGFIHDSSIFCVDQQKVFLDCVPEHFTAIQLAQKLSALGYNILNIPKVLKGISLRVCLKSVDEAQRLILQGSFILDGICIKVRPFKSVACAGRCSVFLGGLADGTTVGMIRKELEQFGVKIVNKPIIKSGFSPQVTLRSAKETQKLIQLAKIIINGVLVSIRPYVNIRKHFVPSKSKK